MIYCVDFDDLCDATADTLSILANWKEKCPELVVTLFTIPRRTSPTTIDRARALGKWIDLAPHGWRHTRGECLGWTSEEAQEKITLARDMGIDAPIFRAPGWLLDADTYTACAALNYAVASHEVYRIPDTKVAEYIYNREVPNITSIHGHLSHTVGFIGDMEFELPPTANFAFAYQLAKVQ